MPESWKHSSGGWGVRTKEAIHIISTKSSTEAGNYLLSNQLSFQINTSKMVINGETKGIHQW